MKQAYQISIIIELKLSKTAEIRNFLISRKPVVLPAEFEDRFIVISFDEDEKTFYMLHAAIAEHVRGMAYLGLTSFKNIIYKKMLDTVISGLPHRKRINEYIECFAENCDACGTRDGDTESSEDIKETLKSNYVDFIKFFIKDIKKIIIQKGALNEP